jgi:hypothetical protein
LLSVVVLSLIMLTIVIHSEIMQCSEFRKVYFVPESLLDPAPGPNVIKLFTAVIYECS